MCTQAASTVPAIDPHRRKGGSLVGTVSGLWRYPGEIDAGAWRRLHVAREGAPLAIVYEALAYDLVAAVMDLAEHLVENPALRAAGRRFTANCQHVAPCGPPPLHGSRSAGGRLAMTVLFRPRLRSP